MKFRQFNESGFSFSIPKSTIPEIRLNMPEIDNLKFIRNGSRYAASGYRHCSNLCYCLFLLILF